MTEAHELHAATMKKPEYAMMPDDEILSLAKCLDPDALKRHHEVEQLRWKVFPALSEGFVTLVDVMGSDAAVVQAARVSYGEGTKKASSNEGLIRYLLRNRHTTPFEMAEVKLLVKVPMDLWRQWIRHRTANVNEYSTRYSVAIDETDTTEPDAWRAQAGSANKQGSGGMIKVWPEGMDEEQTIAYVRKTIPSLAGDDIEIQCDEAGVVHCGGYAITSPGHYLTMRESHLQRLTREVYEERVNKFGVAREQARKDLPLSTYTMAYWKNDLHNLLHFLGLRMDPHAQLEIREFATIIGEEIVAPLFPAAWDAFEKYRRQSTFVSGPCRDVLAAMQKHYSGDDCHCVEGSYSDTAFEAATEIAFPAWMRKDDDGNLKPHREREEVRSTLTSLGLLSAGG